MLTQQQIQMLIALPKTIVEKRPSQGYREESGSRRCDLDLQSIGRDDEGTFTVFVRQNLRFMENFSIGLCYKKTDLGIGKFNLVRYNGPHGERSRSPDGHYAKSHIHRISEQDFASGSTQPQERDRTITDQYATLEEALPVFFREISVSNYHQYFPNFSQLQLRFSHGHQ
ncbi:MAG TPA: hypothetical protein DD643_05795 [Synechococcus sp. UBA8638]|nr:hypothetical protein [Synechococcus sp. UBA8638]